IRLISQHYVKSLHQMCREEGIERLSGCFHWTEFDGDDKRQYLHQEFVYENVMFAVARGLSWSAVGQVADISKHLLPKLREVICLVKDHLSQIEPRLSTAHHAVLLDCIVKTYVPHQRLYQAALNGETGVKHIRCELEIESPPHPRPLGEGTDAVEWKRQQDLKELSLAQSRKEAEIKELKETAEAQLMATLQTSLNRLPHEGWMSRQVQDISYLQYPPYFATWKLFSVKDTNTRIRIPSRGPLPIPLNSLSTQCFPVCSILSCLNTGIYKKT
uniref:Si:dkey-100n19.2 n=1 Tax=Cyprinus carpio TaxID=7962 RepID=A0A8C2FMF5_CYPCA